MREIRNKKKNQSPGAVGEPGQPRGKGITALALAITLR
jgi:hypothetical protein